MTCLKHSFFYCNPTICWLFAPIFCKSASSLSCCLLSDKIQEAGHLTQTWGKHWAGGDQAGDQGLTWPGVCRAICLSISIPAHSQSRAPIVTPLSRTIKPGRVYLRSDQCSYHFYCQASSDLWVRAGMWDNNGAIEGCYQGGLWVNSFLLCPLVSSLSFFSSSIKSCIFLTATWPTLSLVMPDSVTPDVTWRVSPLPHGWCLPHVWSSCGHTCRQCTVMMSQKSEFLQK